MPQQRTKWIGLIRGIGPSTYKKMSMQQLRDACEDAGFENVATILATGNLLFESNATKKKLQHILHDILAQFALENPVILRKPAELKTILALNPFPEAALTRPNHMLVVFLDHKPTATQLKKLCRYDGPENILADKRELYLDYKNGVGSSKLTPDYISRQLQQEGTARNWNTITRLIKATGN